MIDQKWGEVYFLYTESAMQGLCILTRVYYICFAIFPTTPLALWFKEK